MPSTVRGQGHGTCSISPWCTFNSRWKVDLSTLSSSSSPSFGCALRFFRCGTRSVGVPVDLVLDLTMLSLQSPFTEDGRQRERLLRSLPVLRKIPFAVVVFGTSSHRFSTYVATESNNSAFVLVPFILINPLLLFTFAYQLVDIGRRLYAFDVKGLRGRYVRSTHLGSRTHHQPADPLPRPFST
jgi:hypothetical protein